MKIVSVSVAIFSSCYIFLGGILYFFDVLYVLPSYDPSSYAFYTKNQDQTKLDKDFDISLQIGFSVLSFMVLAEFIIFVWTLNEIKEVKEFNFTPEMTTLCFTWVGIQNMILFLVLQGLYSEWFSLICCQRIITYGLITRSLLTMIVTSWPSIKASYQEGAQIMPIPPNRECIETVDMVLHIPIAVDYFYDYLMNRPTEE